MAAGQQRQALGLERPFVGGRVTSLRHDGARALCVSVNQAKLSGVGSAQGAAGSSETTAIMPGAPPA